MPIKKLALWLMTAAGAGILAWWLLTRAGTDQIQVILRLLPGLSKPWMAASVMLQAVFFSWQSVLFRGIFRTLGFNVPIQRLLIITLVSRLTGYVVPLGTAAAIAAFVAIARRDGLPVGASTLANSLFHLINYISFGLFVGYSLVFVKYARVTPGTSAVPLTIMLALVIVVATAGGMIFKNPLVVVTAFRKAVEAAAKIPGRIGQAGASALRNFSDVETTILRLHSLSIDPGSLASIMASSSAITFAEILLLYSAVRATGAWISFGALTAAFTTGTVAARLTFIPNGTGVYIVSLWAALAQMGVDSTTAGTAALVYRAVTFWLPAVAGLFALRYV